MPWRDSVYLYLYSACFSSFKPIFEWSSEDLEYGIVKEDQWYKNQNTLTLLSYPDLPRIVDLKMWKLEWHFWKMFFLMFFLLKIVSFSFLKKLLKQINFLMVYFLHEVYLLPLIPCNTWPQNYIVDSPAHNTEGKPYVNWSGIIIKLEYILELIGYIKDIYENISTMSQISHNIDFSF